VAAAVSTHGAGENGKAHNFAVERTAGAHALAAAARCLQAISDE
jgi:hypothetical protein